MQAKNLNGGQELICMNVDKVYDWILNERNFDLTVPAVAIPFLPTTDLSVVGILDDAVVTCTVEPDEDTPIEVLSREDRTFVIDGTQVTLQQLNIRKNFVVTLIVTLADGTVLTSDSDDLVPDPLVFSRCEQVIMCAPEGTDVELTYTDLDCFVCTPGTLVGADDGTITFTGLTITVATCQSIQSTFPVTVEFLAEFCEPRADLVPPCPAPSLPPQCPTVFPAFGNGDNGDNG